MALEGFSIGSSAGGSGTTAAPSAPVSTGGSGALSGFSIGAQPASGTPVSTGAAPTVPATQAAPKSAAIAAPAPVTPVNTGGLFSKFTNFVGSEIGKASDAISKFTSAPSPDTLGTNATANTLKYLPSELARTIPGISDVQDDVATPGASAPSFYTKVVAPKEIALTKQKQALDALAKTTNRNDAKSVAAYNAAIDAYNADFDSYKRDFDKYTNVAASDKANGTEGTVRSAGIASYFTPDTYEESLIPAAKDVARGLAGAALTVAAAPYALAQIGLNPTQKGPNYTGFKVNIPGLGDVSDLAFQTVDAVVNKGEDPLVATLNATSVSIFDSLMLADVVSRIAGPRYVKLAETKGNVNDFTKSDGTGPKQTIDPGPKTGRVYEAPTATTGARVMSPEMLAKMKSQGLSLGSKFKPEQPVFFRSVLGKGGTYTTELIQIKPSYLQEAFNKMPQGASAPSVPALLSGDATAASTAVPPAELAILATKAPTDEVEVLHSKTVTQDAVLKGIQEAAQKSQPLEAARPIPISQPPVASTAQTVTHNILSLGGGDTLEAKPGSEILEKEIAQHVSEVGVLATHAALQERLGVDAATATKLIQEAGPTPTLPRASKALVGFEMGSPKPQTDDEIRDSSNAEVEKNLPALVDKYVSEFGNHIGADEAKELIDAYKGDRSTSDLVAKAANTISEAVYDHLLEANQGTKNNTVLMTAGGTGVGKSTALRSAAVDTTKYPVIFDTNLSNAQSGIARINKALDKGFKVDIQYVYASPEKAYDRVLDRTQLMVNESGSGRPVGAQGHIDMHHGSYTAIQQVAEHFQGNPNVQITFHNNDGADAHTLDNGLDFIKNVSDNKTNTNELHENLQRQQAEAFHEGRITEQTNAAFDRSNQIRPRKKLGGVSPGFEGGGKEPTENVLATKPIESPIQRVDLPVPMRGFINPYEIADSVVDATKQVSDYIEQSQKTTELTSNVNDAIYQHEGSRKANRQRAIELLQTRGKDLTAQQWENLYHYDENSDEKITDAERKVYDEVIVPIKDALTKSRAEYRDLGGYITADLQQEMTPRYAKEKGGPIDKLLKGAKAGAKMVKGLYNGGLLSKSVAGGAKHRIFFSLEDTDGNRTVVSIPNAKSSRVTAFRDGALSDLGSKSGKEGKTFTDEEGKTYKITQATTKEIEQHTNTRYHKNVLANYVLAFDRTSNALSALKLLDRLTKSPEFSDLIVKESPDEEPPKGWVELSGKLPQFRGYYAEPKLAEALTDLAARLQGREPLPVLDEINNILTAFIVFNPVMHVPNVAMGWASAEAAAGKIPGISPKSAQNFATAFNEVKNKGPLYLSYLEHGAPLMALKNTAREFTQAVLEQYTDEVKDAPGEWDSVSKALGYANPAAWLKGLGHLNETITWGSNDVLFMHAMLDYADREGVTPEKAIKMVSKRMADYRLPSRIGPGKFGRAVSQVLQSRGFLFARYHYSGVIKPWVESFKDTAGPKSTFKQRREGARALVYLALMALVVYPYIDKLFKGITGSPTTYITRAGATKLVETGQKLAAAGAVGIPAAAQSVFTLSPAMTAAIELGFNVDLYTRNPLYGPPPAEGMAAFGTSMVAPLASGSRLTPEDFALSLFGIYTPKNAPGKSALLTQKNQELPALQSQVKKLIVAGDQKQADALMAEFNQRAIANWNSAQLLAGKPPLNPDGSENEAFLKEWGIKEPGVKALTNASALYGNGALTSSSSLVDRVVTYAKAVGTDPVDAFADIFKGQQIVSVSNPGFLSQDSAVIVQRDALSESSARKDFGKAQGKTPEEMAGLQLDHIIPLEDGGINDRSNYQLVSSYNNEVLHGYVENPIADALKEGTISRAHAREYIIRYKAGTLGEQLTPALMDEFNTKYGGQGITPAEVNELIASGKAK